MTTDKMNQKLEKELKDIGRIRKDLEAQRIINYEEKREWIPEHKEWVESYRMRGVQSWDEDTSHWKTTPAHWSVAKIPIYGPDTEKQKKARKQLDQLVNNSEFCSVKYAIAPEEEKWVEISHGLERLDSDFDLDDIVKLFEMSKERLLKKRLVELSKAHAYEEMRRCIRCNLRGYFEKNELKNKYKREYQLGNIGYIGGCVGSILGTCIAYAVFPEFKEFMSSWGLLKGIGIAALATNGLGIGGRKLGEKLDERRANKQYKEWLEE